MTCPGSTSLVQVTEDAPAAEAGTEEHARVLRPDACPPMLSRWLSGDLPPLMFHFEQSYAWLPGSFAQWQGSNLFDKYADVPRGAICGTADAAMWWFDDDTLYIRVADLKTGHQQVYGGSLPSADKSWQLRTLATLIYQVYLSTMKYRLALADSLNCEIGTIAPNVDCKVCFYYKRDEVERIDEATFTRADLERYGEQLKDLADRIQNAPGREFKRGGHCTYCPGFEHCPAQREALFRLRPLANPNATPTTPPITAENVVAAWQDLQAAQRIVDLAKATILSAVQRSGSLPLGDGRELVIRQRETARYDVDQVMGALRRVDPALEPLGNLITKRTVTKESIRVGLQQFIDGWRQTHDLPEALLSELSVEALNALFTETKAVTVTQSAPFLAERKTK